MDEFIDIKDLPKLKQKNVNNWTRFIINNSIEAVVNSSPTKTSQVLDGFTAGLYLNFKKELISMLLKPIHRIEW
jgi:hypothetical protein